MKIAFYVYKEEKNNGDHSRCVYRPMHTGANRLWIGLMGLPHDHTLTIPGLSRGQYMGGENL